jgi:hypothetical protein
VNATDKLLAAYHRATPEQKRRGRDWYDAAREACETISLETGVALDRVAAVMAITSPDAKLATNIAWTRAACAAKQRRLPLTAGRYPANQRPKVQRALDQRRKNPGEAVRGPKVSAFYRAIMGDDDTLVIDRWAAFAAGFGRQRPPTRRQAATIEAAYRQAAASVGESVRDFQAIVWIVVRESTRRSDGQLHRHFDFNRKDTP